MDAALKPLTANEVRADFARRLQRRMEAMAKGCDTAAEQSAGAQDHAAMERSVAKAAHWRNAGRLVELMLGECNGEEDANG